MKNDMLGWMGRGAIGLMLACLSATAGCSDDPATPAADAATPTDTAADVTPTDVAPTDATPTDATPTDAPAGMARVRVIHAAPRAGNVDIFAAGSTTAAAPNVAYGTATGYLSLPPGPIAFDIRAAGAMGAPAFTTPSITLVAGRSYTVIAAGRLGSTDAADRFRVIPLAENFGADATNARVRVVHAGSDAPTVGVDVGNDNPAAPEVASLERFADTGEAGVSLPGNAALQVGLTAGGSTVTAFTTPNLGAGNQWFVIATGLLPSTDTAVNDGFGLLAVNQMGTAAFIKQNPRVHVVHAGADAPAVDLFAGPAGAGANPMRTVQIVDNLSYPVRMGTTTTGGLASAQVPPGSYGIDIFPYAAGSARPAGAPAFTVPTLALEPGRQYVAIAANFLSPPAGRTPPASAFTVLPLEYAMTNDATTATAPRVVAVHAAGDAPNVDIGALAGSTFTPIFTNVARGANSPAAGTTAPLDPFVLAVRAAGATANAATFNVDLDVNQKVFVIASGALQPRPAAGGGLADQSFHLSAVFANPGTVQLGAGAWSLARVNPNPSTTATARLRVVHAAPGAPNVDVSPAGGATPAARNIAYGTATGYLDLPAGPIAFDIRAAGATGAPAFTTPVVTLEAGRSYTVIAAGRLGSMNAADRFRVIPLAENFTADATNARVRVVHAGSDAPTVGVDVGNDNPAAPEVASLERFADTGEAGVSLPGNAALQVGLTAGGSTVTAFTTPNLGAGNQWFVIATGLLPSTDTAVNDGFGLLAVNQMGTTAFIKQNPRVHVVHAGVDAPAVDLFAGPAGAGANPMRTLQIVDNLNYPVRTGTTTTGGIASAQVPPGSYGIDIFPYAAGSARPAGAPAFTVPTVAVEAGRQYVAIAAYYLAPPSGRTPPASSFTVLPLRYEITNDATTATAPRIVAVHAAGDAPNVDIGVSAGATFTPLFTNVARGATSPLAGTTAPLDPFTVAIRAAGGTTNAATFSVDLDVNQKVFVIAAGALTPRAAMGGGRADQGFGLHAVTANPGTVQLGTGAWTLARLNPNAT